MGYTHLTAGERYQIYTMHRNGNTLQQIGDFVGRNKSSVSRELRRNRGERGYRAKQAHELASERRSVANAGNVRRIPQATWDTAEAMLRQEHSPEQVSGRLRLIQGEAVSHETLYRRIYEDKADGGDLHLHLRSQKKRRKRYGSGQRRRGVIPNRVGIEERPACVEQRLQVGHWEMDTVVGRNHKGYLVTMVERKSRFLCTVQVPQKTAALVAKAIMVKLGPLSSLNAALLAAETSQTAYLTNFVGFILQFSS